MKKFTALLLALVMILSLLPMAALAAEEPVADEEPGVEEPLPEEPGEPEPEEPGEPEPEEPGEPEPEEPEADYVAQVDGVGYETLQEAVSAADGGTVTLLADVADYAEVVGTVTLDLNGHTLTNPQYMGVALENFGDLTITGGTVCPSAYSDLAANLISNYAVMTIAGGSFVNADNELKNEMALICNYGAEAELTISGGTFSHSYRVLVENLNDATLTVTGGSFTSSGAAAIQNSANAVISGGTVTGHIETLDGETETTGALSVAGSLRVSGGRLAVTGGSYDVTWAVTGGEVAVTGGTFGADVTAYIPQGYAQGTDGRVAAVELALTPAEGLDLMVGGFYDVELALTPAGAPASWQSDNEKVATVSESGRITAVRAGKATVTVTVSGVSAQLEVRVTAQAVEEPEPSPAPAPRPRPIGGGGNPGGGSTATPPEDPDLGDFEDLEDEDTPLAGGVMLFTDVKAGDWYYGAVKDMFDRGLMKGTTADTFSPKALTTRGTIVMILWRMANSPDTGVSSFSDVAPSAWYTKAVAWAARYGIVTGYPDGRFGPDDNVTREQLALILNRYAAYLGVNSGEVELDLSAFTDGATVSAGAVQAMCWATQKGIINGKSGNLLDPQGYAQRCEVATMLSRFATLVAKGLLG